MSRSLYSAFRCPSSALHSVKHVRHRSCNHLRGAFIGLIFIYLPGQLLSWSGIARPALTGPPQIAGMIIGGIGAAIALWCIFAFAAIGKGTPAPFDPPRRLVIEGPYRFVRNPMYIGATLGLAGTAIFYGSLSLSIYTAAFLLAAHLFVVFYEEPTLRKSFGAAGRSVLPASQALGSRPNSALPFKN